jgi:plastocyanin
MKKLAVLFALILAALALVACGGGGSSSTSEETSSGGAAKEETSEGEGEGEKEAEGGSAGSASAVDIEADPSGNLAFTSDTATAKAGKATVNFTNESPVPHDVKIEDENGEEVGGTEVISEGSDSAEVELEPGTYTYFCSIPGHRQAGMEGTLTVK